MELKSGTQHPEGYEHVVPPNEAEAPASSSTEQEKVAPEREITFEKLYERYMALGEEDTPELRAFIQQEVDDEDRLWRENPELAARRNQYRREFMAVVKEHYQIPHR